MRLIACALVALLWAAGPAPASADEGERYAVVISGASGGDVYAQKYRKIRTSLAATLRDAFTYKADHLFLLGEDESDGAQKATRESVQRLFTDLRKRLGRDDQLLVVLIGHGTSDGGDDA